MKKQRYNTIENGLAIFGFVAVVLGGMGIAAYLVINGHPWWAIAILIIVGSAKLRVSDDQELTERVIAIEDLIGAGPDAVHPVSQSEVIGTLERVANILEHDDEDIDGLRSDVDTNHGRIMGLTFNTGHLHGLLLRHLSEHHGIDLATLDDAWRMQFPPSNEVTNDQQR